MIKIIETVDRIPMKDASDIRSFIEGEIHALSPANEEHLITLGIAEPAVVASVEAVDIVPAAAAAEDAVHAVSEAPAADQHSPELAAHRGRRDTRRRR